MKHLKLPLTEKIYRKKVVDIIELFNNTHSTDIRRTTKYLGEFYFEKNQDRRETVFWDNTILQVQRIDLINGEIFFRLNKLHQYFEFISDGLDNDEDMFFIRCRAAYRSFNFEPIAMDLILRHEIKALGN